MKFTVNIREILEREVEIEAENLQEAHAKAEQQYRDEKIVLNEADYKGTEITVRQRQLQREKNEKEEIEQKQNKHSCKFKSNAL